jgi:hypothetical protein
VTATTTIKTAVKMDTKPAQVRMPMLWNFRTDAVAATTTVAIKDHQTVHAACVDKALRPIDTPRIPDPAQRIYAIKNKAPTSSLSTVPPSTAAMSAIEWHPGCAFRKSPWIIAVYVLSAPQPITDKAPPNEPKLAMAVGMLRTPVAKMTALLLDGNH